MPEPQERETVENEGTQPAAILIPVSRCSGLPTCSTRRLCGFRDNARKQDRQSIHKLFVYDILLSPQKAEEREESINYGLSDQVRVVALEKYVHPAIRAGKLQFSVAVRDLMRHLQADGFPSKNWPQICTAIQAEKFLRRNGLEIEGVDGPPKKQSPTVVVHYRVARSGAQATPRAKLSADTDARGDAEVGSSNETPSARAYRLTERLRGLLKEELAEYGGGEAFLRWVRGYDEEDVA